MHILRHKINLLVDEGGNRSIVPCGEIISVTLDPQPATQNHQLLVSNANEFLGRKILNELQLRIITSIPDHVPDHDPLNDLLYFGFHDKKASTTTADASSPQAKYSQIVRLHEECLNSRKYLLIRPMNNALWNVYLIPIEPRRLEQVTEFTITCLFECRIERLVTPVAPEPSTDGADDHRPSPPLKVNEQPATIDVSEETGGKPPKKGRVESDDEEEIIDQQDVDPPDFVDPYRSQVNEQPPTIDANEEIWEISPGLSIFPNQLKTAVELYKCIRGRHMLEANTIAQKVNFLFLGPVHTEILEQTQIDLSNFLLKYDCVGHKGQSEVLASIISRVVLNSNAVGSEDRNISNQFLDNMKKHPNDFLHIIIHDEAHWGIRTGSMLHNFYSEVATILDAARLEGRPEPMLVIIPVTATPEIFLNTRNFLESHRYRSVEMTVPSCYKSFADLRILNDENIARDCSTIRNASSVVVTEYLELIGAMLRSLRGEPSAFHEIETSYNTTFQALVGSVMKGFSTSMTSAESKAFLDATAEYKRTDRNTPLFVRLASIEIAKRLKNGILEAFDEYKVHPFEVVSLMDGNNLADQLSVRARSLVTPGQKFSDIQAFPLMIIVVERFSIGARIPINCTMYDVRGRYLSNDKYITTNQAAFVQDIGRCCGYGKGDYQCTVLLALKLNLNSLEDDLKFRTRHGCLTPKDDATKDFDVELYQRWANHSIVLNSLPQSGKTGTFLALLYLLHYFHSDRGIELIDQLKVSYPKVIPGDQVWTSQNPRFADLLQVLRRAANNGQLIPYLNTDNRFRSFHQQLAIQRQYEHITGFIDSNKLVYEAMESFLYNRSTITILDVGCGLYGFASFLSAKSDADFVDFDVEDWRIIGCDVNHEVGNLSYTFALPHSIQFTPVVHDFMTLTPELMGLTGTSVDFVVFNMSLLALDISPQLSKAYDLLKVGGKLIIADFQNRFDSSFVQHMTNMGWKHIKSESENEFACHSFEKKPKKQQNGLNNIAVSLLDPDI